MPHFTFKAKKSSGEIYTDEKDAADRYELYRMIRESGDEVISVGDKKAARGLSMNISLSFLKRVKTIEKINFARNLGAMLQAGLALSRALTVLERQSKNAYLVTILHSLTENISKGMTFADSLAKFPKVFSPLFVSMVHAGEQSGTLADSLKVVATQTESAYNLERRIRGALMYPSVIVFAMILIAVLMLIFVIPTLMKTFVEMHVPLPVTTQIVLAVSDTVQHRGIFVLIGLIIVGCAYWRWQKTARGKSLVHALELKIPVVGGLIQEVNTARTARTLSSLMDSGVDIVEAVNITSGVVQNVHYKEVLDKARDAIKKGDTMSKVFSQYDKLYPVFFAEMMSVGEETGKMGEMLLGVAHYYEDDVDQRTKDMSTVIEPFLMLLIGGAVGFFAVSMITPMYSLVNAI
jgi:type IV pilus assembly protein PilC